MEKIQNGHCLCREIIYYQFNSKACYCQSSSLEVLLAQRNMILSEPASAVLPILQGKKKCKR